MGKINILFNNKNYSVDESAFAAASTALKSYMSTVMNGSGATINFGGSSFNIDSTKLTTATNAFISHLGTIGGNGYKVKVNGIEYSVDSAKLIDSVAELEDVLGDLNSGGGNDPEDEIFPIEWNAYDVANNTKVTLNGYGFVKVSSAVPSLNLFHSTFAHLSVDSAGSFNLDFNSMVDYGNGYTLINYSSSGMTYSIFIAPVAGEYSGIYFAESGIYALDYNALGNPEFNISICYNEGSTSSIVYGEKYRLNGSSSQGYMIFYENGTVESYDTNGTLVDSMTAQYTASADGKTSIDVNGESIGYVSADGNAFYYYIGEENGEAAYWTFYLE